eukprot:c7370_g1_i2.p1 GENE.c7370_g1_i2~~c7370_g1_i2.p1  ORF type:complete len:332 (+),score=54.17 c7370_g1_i2:25-996(+)
MAASTFDGTIAIQIRQAKDLLAHDRNGFSDPYAVAQADTCKVKTPTVAKTLNPTWNTAATVGPFRGATNLVVTVFDYDRFGSNDTIGSLTMPISALAPDTEVSGWYPLDPPSGSAAGTAAGSIELAMTFTKRVVPPEEIVPELPVLAEGETVPRTAEDQGKVFSKPFADSLIQRLCLCVNLPFLSRADEVKLYNMLLGAFSLMVPTAIISFIVDKVKGLHLPEDMLRSLFSDELKHRIVNSFSRTFDIPFLSESTERSLFASGYLAIRNLIQQEMCLITWLVEGVRHLLSWRIANNVSELIPPEPAAAVATAAVSTEATEPAA